MLSDAATRAYKTVGTYLKNPRFSSWSGPKLHRCNKDVMWSQQGPLSPQLDEPVEDEEDEEAEEEHVAQQFGLAASGELLDPADGGAQKAPCGVEICVLGITTEIRTGWSPARQANKRSDPRTCFIRHCTVVKNIFLNKASEK